MIAKSCCGVAALGLSGLLTLSVAHAAEIKREEGTLPSRFPYMINVPANWNGIVINDLDAVANKDGKFAAYLLDHGYAYSGTGRHPERMTRHAQHRGGVLDHEAAGRTKRSAERECHRAIL